ncbi:MAG: methylcobamide--CoM methyltransferase [Lachnospiraceae bacterium]|nr:methylcobamide--CoM methyltransferase [Lachnospiraceae bacterium]
MERIADFKCGYDNANGFGTWAGEEYGILFPQAYKEADMMRKLALAVKEHERAGICYLPFCHTLEAEALGGKIKLGDGLTGPRVERAVCSSLEDVLELPSILLNDHKTDRLRETMEACKTLKEMGESVVFLVSGPMTILNGLMESEVLFRALRKTPELVIQTFEKLGSDVLAVMKLAEAAEVDAISYADPSGGVNLVGPKIAEKIARGFTMEFLKQADEMLDKKIPIYLCPKTAFALIGTELARWRDWQLEEAMEYSAAVEHLKGKIRFVGQDCVKHVGHRLENRILKELVLR